MTLIKPEKLGKDIIGRIGSISLWEAISLYRWKLVAKPGNLRRTA
jgi:hypothetical protein